MKYVPQRDAKIRCSNQRKSESATHKIPTGGGTRAVDHQDRAESGPVAGSTPGRPAREGGLEIRSISYT